MVCPRCTLLHLDYAAYCRQCGHPLRSMVQRIEAVAIEKAPLSIGVISGTSLLSCLAVALAVPAVSTQALAVGAYFGIISIANIWLSVYRDDQGELLRGMRGLAYSAALMFSLIGELARLQNLHSLPLPAFPGLPSSIPTPSAMVTEMLAAVLIALDPLVVTPLLRWVEDGVQRSEPELGPET